MAASAYLTTDILTTGQEQVISPDRKGSIVSFDKTQLDAHVTDVTSNEHHGYDLPGPEPTDEEFATLRKVAGKMPTIAYTLCAVEFAERASYYGVSQIFSNFVQFPLPEGGNGAGAPPVGSQKTAGALGLGLQGSSGINQTFKFLAYTLPILGAWIADVHWGRFKTICLGVALCGVAHVIMAAGAVPSVLQRGQGVAPFIISMIMLAVGAGLFKSNVSPLLIDQNPHKRPYVSTLKSGERVIIDPEATISRILLWFYMQVNVGAFFALATTYAEKRVGWWLAYLLPAIIYFLLPILLAVMYKKTVKVKPSGNELTKVFAVIGAAMKKNGIFKFGKKGFLNAAKPSVSGNHSVSWDDKFVDDVGRTLVACQIFLFFPLFYMNDSGIGSVQNSQGGTLTTDGAPNDLLNNFNPLTIIVFIPILNYGLYPLLRKYKIRFGRIARITTGFALVAVNGLIGTILQYKVYKTSPCGYRATECAEEDGTVSPILIWAQIPIYVLGAVAETFAVVTAYEVAYSRSSPNLKSVVTSAFLFMNALASAIGAAVTPATKDPYLIWIFAGPTIGGFILTPIFWYLYKDLDKEDESKMNLYDLPQDLDGGVEQGGVRERDLPQPSPTEKEIKPEGLRHSDEKVTRTDLAPGAAPEKAVEAKELNAQ